jgi:hypothetical protein
MGKTSQPLTIWAWSPWFSHETLRALAAQSHTIIAIDDAQPTPDLILHPAAHRWTDAFWDEPAYLAAALKRARMAKREAKT